MPRAFPTKIPRWAVVSIEWDDACAHGGPHVVDKFLATHKVVKRRTCGYVLYYDKVKILIASTDDRNSDIPEQECEDITAIPMGMVTAIHVLK